MKIFNKREILTIIKYFKTVYIEHLKMKKSNIHLIFFCL